MHLNSLFPISSSICERSFSAMRRFKSWSRTSMGQERFTKIERDITNKLRVDDGEVILKKFALLNRKLNLV